MPQITALGLCVWVDTYAIHGVRRDIANEVLKKFTLPNLSNCLEQYHVFVVAQQAHVLAYCCVTRQAPIEIETLYVLPKFQRKGIGSRLLNFIIAEFGAVFLSCWEGNSRAISFYRSYGFNQDGISWYEFEGQRYKNLVFKYTI